MANRFDDRRRSLSDDSYDHLRRRRDSGDYGRPRRRSFDRNIYSRVRRRSRDRSPDDIYSRPRRHSIEGPPSEYYVRRRRASGDNGNLRNPFPDNNDPYGQVIRRYSYDGMLPDDGGKMRRHVSDPYINYTPYDQSVVPVGGVRSGYTVMTQPAYQRVAQPLVNHVRRPARVEYIDNPVQYVQAPAPAPIQYIQRPAPAPIQYIQRPAPAPIQYVQRPAPAPIQYVQRPVVQPVQYIQRSLPPPVQYVERPVVQQVRYVQRPAVKEIIEKPVLSRRRYQIEGDLTPVMTGPETIHVKYDNLNTKYENVNTNYGVMPQTSNVREVTNYQTQPLNIGNSYTAYYLGRNGTTRMIGDEGNTDARMVKNGFHFDDKETGRGKELDHVLYFGKGRMKEIYDKSDYNNNYNMKSRIIR